MDEGLFSFLLFFLLEFGPLEYSKRLDYPGA